jgi:flagellar biosynthesis protein
MTDRPSDPNSEPASRSRPQERAVAVALRDQAASGRPKIVASGHGIIAQRILEIAFAAGVKVREDADLAEVLAALEIGREVPLEAFTAVAEILSYVYRANEAARADLGRGASTALGVTP